MLLVYITFPGHDLALQTGRQLVANRLAAGVNIINDATSIYRWAGEIRQREECILFAQTTEGAWNDLVTTVRSIHEDLVPCIVGMEIAWGFPPFLEWIEKNTILCDSH